MQEPIPSIKFLTALEIEAHDMREALLALECGYDEANIRSLSRRTQELIAVLKEGA